MDFNLSLIFDIMTIATVAIPVIGTFLCLKNSKVGRSVYWNK